jgi:WD40 repeat protein
MTHDADITFVVFSPNSKYVVSGSDDHTARVWEATTGKEIARMTYEGDVSSAAFSSDGKYIVSGGCDKIGTNGLCTEGTARVWEATTGKEIARMIHDGSVSSVAFSPDGKYVVSDGCYGRDIYDFCIRNSTALWEANTGKEIQRVFHNSGVSSVAFSLDVKYMAFGSQTVACVWEIATDRGIACNRNNNSVTSVTFSPDSKYVMSGSGDGTALVWIAAKGREIAHFTHDKAVITAAFSPDGKYVVSGSLDNTARIWVVTTGNEIARMTHDGKVTSVVFSPDGKFVASGSDDGSTRVWIWRPEDLITGVCSHISRNLTRAEWNQYLGDESYQVICTNIYAEPAPLEEFINNGTWFIPLGLCIFCAGPLVTIYGLLYWFKRRRKMKRLETA